MVLKLFSNPFLLKAFGTGARSQLFFSFYTSTPIYLSQVLAKSQTGNQTSINQQALKSILVISPSLTEQQEIADILSSCDAKIAALEREINLHDELFRAMLEELMTGKLSSLPLA